MKPLLISMALAGSVAALPGCTAQGREAAWGTPYTDITATNTEPGAYAKSSPYSVIGEEREGAHLILDVNVTNAGKIDQVGREVVNEKKDGASAVTVHVYPSDEKPPKPPWQTVDWTAAGGFTTH